MTTARNPKRIEVSFSDPEHMLEPEDLLSFIEAQVFRGDWRACGLKDDDLWMLQTMILSHPDVGKVIGGTGGLRKFRFSPPGSNRGKSGSHRVCYVFFEEYGIVYLITAYPKNVKDTLSASEKAAIRAMIERIQVSLEERGPIR